MSKRMCALTKYEMIQLREEGKTLDEIAQLAGITRQRVGQYMDKFNVRKGSVNIEKIRYKGIYEFMKENPGVSYAQLARAIYGGATTNAKCNDLIRKFAGERSDCIHFTVAQLKRLIKYTHKSFEELFTLRDSWEA